MSEELAAMQKQMANTKEDAVKEKSKNQGTPVYAAYKDGLVLEDGTGNWALQVNGRIQADYHNIDPSEWKNDSFSIRRARLGATFTFLKDFAVRVECEYANSNDGAKFTTALAYGYIEYNHFPDASFNSAYDRGLMLFGSPFKGTYYNLSYVNGSGQNHDDNGNSKDYVGHVAANIADWAEWKNTVVHVGLSASGVRCSPLPRLTRQRFRAIPKQTASPLTRQHIRVIQLPSSSQRPHLPVTIWKRTGWGWKLHLLMARLNSRENIFLPILMVKQPLRNLSIRISMHGMPV